MPATRPPSEGVPSPRNEAGAGAPARPAGRGRLRRRLEIALFLVPLAAVLVAGAYFYLALHYTYSSGDRAGYVQKFSKKGWVCKTWEGELAMVNMPGAMPEIFRFSVRDDAVAAAINRQLGARVVLSYEQHDGLPRCFGETQYFITAVRPVKP
jgi:hypothetical protein